MFSKPKSEYELISGWRNGNEKAFDQLFKFHFYKLNQFALRHTGDPELSEELVMDIMLKVWQKRDKLEQEQASLAPFLFHTLKAAIIDNYRKKRVALIHIEEIKEEPKHSAQSDDNLLATELSDLYQTSLRYLSPKKRLVLEMRKEQGMSYKMIATELNISVKTVDSYLSEAVLHVKEYLRKHTDIALLIIILFIL
ncbi:RNA polymerase sigma factor [Pedobacter alluvionis]|uniref:RNA polymerase sigma-70 factor (ECF subfamily) n=1 Tax=Pedobacter alluvionis TaxID=475253 RepID=A0A497XLQ4_9SPHI|nr:sigma-70 family RNA polymerase sigma factor [Pedobacter alluvionis]RLJ69583.1 RNA polymerase sigma-70 factor (ECF subfamily) [Pedobacter alluvionis]TFB28356.1 sigma-70 family RNA polymerase sigma factor [Pedobacter alluvionis]